ncbi:hypothetical protein AVEN_129185-1, partial [Araneus ventricosus]
MDWSTPLSNQQLYATEFKYLERNKNNKTSYIGGSYPKIFKRKFMAVFRVAPVVTKVLAAVRTLDPFSISDRVGAAIVSAALEDVGVISESNVLNVVDRNKIRRGRTKARTTLLSQVIKDYDHDQFGLYFDGRKDRTLSMEDNRRKVTIEHISLIWRMDYETREIIDILLQTFDSTTECLRQLNEDLARLTQNLGHSSNSTASSSTAWEVPEVQIAINAQEEAPPAIAQDPVTRGVSTESSLTI